MNPRSEETWRGVARDLEHRERSEEARARFWMVIDAWIRDLLLVGPENDTSACRVKPRFRSLLPDPHAALDFAAELTIERVKQWSSGRFDDEGLEGLDRLAGLSRIASASFVRLRALSSLRHRNGAGLVGLPADAAPAWSLDGADDVDFAGSLEDEVSAPAPSSNLVHLLASLESGAPVLRLHAASTRIGAILVTAAMQLLPRLVPDEPSNVLAIEAMERDLAGPIDSVDLAQQDAATLLADLVESLQRELFEHPGMEPAAVAKIERRIVRARADLVVQPLSGRTIAGLLGLASANAGEQRNSKYRARLADLLPELAALTGLLEPGGAEGAVS